MATYKPTSWGRTRRPKHLRENVPPAKQAATTVTVVTAAQLVQNLTSTDEGRNGYSTENQRYLHVLVSHASANKSLDIYAYNYAFGEWSPLFLNLGSGAFQRATATAGSGGAAQHYIFEIAGIDRIAFVSSDPPDVCRAACSTF